VDAPFVDPAAQGVSGNGFDHGFCNGLCNGFCNDETSRQAIRFCSRL